jgi:hypothetical protein
MSTTTPDVVEILGQAKLQLNPTDGLLHDFADEVIDKAVEAYGLDADAVDKNDASAVKFRERLIYKMLSRTFPLDKFKDFFMGIWNEAMREGDIPAWIDLFDSTSEVGEDKLTPAVRDKMAAFLLDRGITLPKAPANTGRVAYRKYQEHLADAYHHAIDATGRGDDPVDAAKAGQSVSTWDFSVDTSEDLDNQEVIVDNVKAAGALYYLYNLCERMGMLKVVDSLVLNWAAGAIDVVDGPGADKLYRYWKMRDERLAEEERAIVYRRVLNLGGGEVLSRMTVNEYFPELWNKLMTEVADYIAKVEKAQTSDDVPLVSRKPIELAARELQYNLTEYATGMVHMQTREIHSIYREAVEILRDDQVLSHFGGRGRKNMWKVIERVSKQELSHAPNVTSVRTLAVDGYKVFQWLVDANTEDEAGFQDFLRSAEAWIIAAGTDEEEAGAREPDDEDEFEGSDDDDLFETEDEEFAELNA